MAVCGGGGYDGPAGGGDARARGGEGAWAAELTFLRRRRSFHALQEHRMSGRAMVMEDGRARENMAWMNFSSCC
jgi:hypothetical protein